MHAKNQMLEWKSVVRMKEQKRRVEVEPAMVDFVIVLFCCVCVVCGSEKLSLAGKKPSLDPCFNRVVESLN